MAHVLIVDDSQLERVILGRIIGQAGHECHFASGGLEALEAYLRGGLDILVTDIEMPHGGGLELIEGLRALLPEAPIIVVSGMRPEVLAEAESKGALAAFSKPVDPDALLEAVAQAVPPPGDDDSREGRGAREAGPRSWRGEGFDMATDEQIKAWENQFRDSGPDQVREGLDAGRFGPPEGPQVKFAEAYLKGLDAERAAKDRAEELGIGREANEIARKANKWAKWAIFISLVALAVAVFT